MKGTVSYVVPVFRRRVTSFITNPSSRFPFISPMTRVPFVLFSIVLTNSPTTSRLNMGSWMKSSPTKPSATTIRRSHAATRRERRQKDRPRFAADFGTSTVPAPGLGLTGSPSDGGLVWFGSMKEKKTPSVIAFYNIRRFVSKKPARIGTKFGKPSTEKRLIDHDLRCEEVGGSTLSVPFQYPFYYSAG
jgi:hypothetical protein